LEEEMSDLDAPWFHDDEEARKHLEAIRWPNGPVCPHCGGVDRIKKLEGKSHRPGLYKCYDCEGHFTVTVGTVMESSRVPLHKWFLAIYWLCSSKKGISSHQLHRMLGVTYKTAWFMTHRIREAMREGSFGPVGGENKVVEADETYVGGKAKNRAFREPPKKEAVFSLVERDGKVHSFHLPSVTAKSLRPVLKAHVDSKSYLMTDEAGVYRKIGMEFNGHGTVNHSIDEYVRGTFWHTNTIEGYFSILKRGINGVYQHVSQQHLKRYLGEFDFRYNTRKMTDWERAGIALKGIEGKRLTYGGPRQAQA
jgi:transposase-like protein